MFSRTHRYVGALVLLLMLSWVSPQFSAASVTIRNIPPTPHFAPAGTDLAEIAAAITLAANEQGWRVIAEAPGVIQASVHIRSHTATVFIGFDESNFWIEYQDSINLDYSPHGRRKTKTMSQVKGPRIHRNYHVWVDQLARKIVIHAKVPPKANVTDTAPPRSLTLIADELGKLDALRERGVLSQEEFDQQKAKLLAQ